MPLILKPRILTTVQLNQLTPRYLPILANSITITASKDNLNEDLDENIDLKDLIQKLYETIYLKMSESYNKSKQSQIIQNNNENEKVVKNSKNKTRSVSVVKENKHLVHKTTPVQHSKIEEEVKVNKIDTNIFNLDSMRQTPKLIALLPVYKQSTKEAVHSMLDMYDWSRQDLFNSKSISMVNTPSLEKSRSKSIMHGKERSNLSNKTVGSANTNRVKFNIDA